MQFLCVNFTLLCICKQPAARRQIIIQRSGHHQGWIALKADETTTIILPISGVATPLHLLLVSDQILQFENIIVYSKRVESFVLRVGPLTGVDRSQG